MKYLDEFRDPQIALRLVDRILATATRRWVIMEVCGGQTHSLLRHGIDAALESAVELLHGPGCPVCVTPVEAIDLACQLALRPRTVVTSFGDMLRVPGSHSSLAQIRAQGGTVRMVYSPLDAVELAASSPEDEIVFFAVGFETTLPATALALLQARERKLSNFSLLSAHVRVLPAMEAILAAPENRVQGFLAAGHVCTITGYDDYERLASRTHVPIVVTGFEPVDLLEGVLACVQQLERGDATVMNRYERSVQAAGNPHAQALVDRVYRIADRPWRGLGVIPSGGYELRDEFLHCDARHRFSCDPPSPERNQSRCRSGDVLSGRIRPRDCAEFGTGCTPENPLGAPMVSSEGACAAYYRYSPLPVLPSCPLLIPNS